MQNYRKDINGRIAKANDHAIDCLRYILDADRYSLMASQEIRRESDPMWRGARITDDFEGFTETGERIDEYGDYDYA